MFSPEDETNHLTETLIFTLNVIVEASPDDRHRIAEAFLSAQTLAASIPIEAGSARPRIVACLEQFQMHKAAEEIEAAGWILCAIQERIAEMDLPEWEKMNAIAHKAA
ncbi:hypothetical protein CN198_14030 [Sinorhizobium meliloti]|uniref:hypothetical protein n=1 Tax=Rhizobium meliloti TaxID=382 RepID=UPI000FD95895|nr:hypothetical protein [Sinorhizobium meliloti]RVH69181.1 hypothetical protein CN198_14030 [Sinorhizobium meliloti]